VRRPADAWIAGRAVTWMVALPVLKRLLPLPTLVKLMWSTTQRPHGQPPERVASITARVGRLSRGNCLDRSLIIYRLLSRGGADPTLVIGFGRQADVIGHTWITLGGRPLLEDSESLSPYTAFVAFGAKGAQTTPR
jgi:hypothetical protein